MQKPNMSSKLATVQPSLIRLVYDKMKPTSLNLGLGQPSMQVPDPIIKEGLTRLHQGSMGYTANAGMLPLRQQVANYYSLEGREDPQSVIITCGAQEAIFAVMMGCLDPGDEVIVPDPAFPSYESIGKLLGATIVRVPRLASNHFRLDTDAIAQQVTDKTKLVVVNSPGNPTGTVDDEENTKKLAQLAAERGFFILSDEVYSKLFYGYAPPSTASYGQNTFLVSSLSKCCAMTGFRLGWIIGPPDQMGTVLKAHHMAVTCAATLSQHMAQFVFENPIWLTIHRTIYQERRDKALSALKKYVPLPIIEPEGAFYILLDISSYSQDSTAFALDLLAKADVITAPGAAFGDSLTSWIRLSFADTSDVFVKAAKRIGAYLSSMPKKEAA